ncbi:hypothetical protein OH77DRAFT_1420825 [Trametes cingulata]|nr:hypothetical protein OH77DRAFT_1427956 [Trametes cingulata]KAI0358441.1 hypothetical protein OH77DRAFT_1420825 [Trametes cingulata]
MRGHPPHGAVAVFGVQPGLLSALVDRSDPPVRGRLRSRYLRPTAEPLRDPHLEEMLIFGGRSRELLPVKIDGSYDPSY